MRLPRKGFHYFIAQFLRKLVFARRNLYRVTCIVHREYAVKNVAPHRALAEILDKIKKLAAELGGDIFNNHLALVLPIL